MRSLRTSACSTRHQHAPANGQTFFQCATGAIPRILRQPFGFGRVGCLETAMAYAFLPRWMRAWWSAPSTIRQHPAVMSADCLIPLSRACTSPVDCRWPSSTGLPPLPYNTSNRLLNHRASADGASKFKSAAPMALVPRRDGEHHPVETHPERDRRGYSTAELPMPGTAARARSDAPSIAEAAQVLRSGWGWRT